MGVKISQLPAVSSLTGTEIFPVVQNGVTSEASINQITSAIVPYTPAGTGAVTRTVQAKLQESVSVLDFGADPTGVNDSTSAFNTAWSSNNPRSVLVVSGTYKITGTVTGNFYSFGPVTISGGGTVTSIKNLSDGANYIVASNMSTSASDNGVILQSYINQVISLAAAYTTTYSLPIIYVPCSSSAYPFTTGITTAPWVKIKPLFGKPVWDFSGMASNGVAVTCNSNSTPSGELNGGAQFGDAVSPYLESISIRRTSAGGTTTGIFLGQTSHDTTNVKECREAFLKNVDIFGFHIGQYISNVDTYLCKWEDCRVYTNDYNYYTQDGATTNAQEKMVIRGGVVGIGASSGGTSGVGFYFGSTGSEFVLESVSCDYASGTAIVINCTYLVLDIKDPHLENSNNSGLIKCTSSGADVFVSMSGQAQIIPHTSVGVSGGWSDGTSTPFQSLIQGPINLSLENLTIQGYDHPYTLATESNLFLCDDSVVLSRAEGVRFTNWPQMISRNKTINGNDNFSKSTPGTNLTGSSDPGGVLLTASYFAAVTVQNATTFAGSTAALQFASSLNACYATVQHRPFPVVPGRTYRAQAVLHGNGAGGVLNVGTQFLWYGMGQFASPVTISSVTLSGYTATVTTSQPHNLVTGQFVVISGASPSAYNNRAYITVTGSTTFTYYCNNSAGTLTTPATVTGATYSVEPIYPIASASADTLGFAALYADASQPNYTGTNTYWARGNYMTGHVAPAGACYAVIATTVSSINSGGSVFLGDVLVSDGFSN